MEVEKVFFRFVLRLLWLHRGNWFELRETDSSLLIGKAGWHVDHFVDMGCRSLRPFQLRFRALYNRRQTTHVGLRNLLSSLSQRLWFCLRQSGSINFVSRALSLGSLLRGFDNLLSRAEGVGGQGCVHH